MASSARSSLDFYSTALENHLVLMARTVEGSVNRSFEALLARTTPRTLPETWSFGCEE